MRRAHLADQQWQNLDKYHYDVTTSDKEPGETTLRVVVSTGSHYPLDHAVQKAENWNEPLRHDSLALLAPKNRNDRNQELEQKSVKKKPRILFSKIFDCRARAATGPKIQSRVDGLLQTLPQPVQRNRI